MKKNKKEVFNITYITSYPQYDHEGNELPSNIKMSYENNDALLEMKNDKLIVESKWINESLFFHTYKDYERKSVMELIYKKFENKECWIFLFIDNCVKEMIHKQGNLFLWEPCITHDDSEKIELKEDGYYIYVY